MSYPQPFRSRIRLLWNLPESRRREIVEPLLRRHASEYSRQALTVEEVRTLARIPLVSFGSHTVRHPSLPHCDPSQLDEELRVSKRDIEDWTGQPLRILAYPKGDFSGREEEALRRSGYDLAVTTEERVYSPRVDGALPRSETGCRR